jgi:hypothetical protein
MPQGVMLREVRDAAGDSGEFADDQYLMWR